MSLAAAIAVLRDAYPRQEFPDRSVALYAHALADMDDQEVTDAIRRLINRSAWLPSVAEIREEVAEARLGLPSGDEAWRLATGPVTDLPPEVREAVMDLGGPWAVRKSDRPELTRRDFLAAYGRRREHALRTATGATVAQLNGNRPQLKAVQDLPESTRIRPRPLMERMMRRWGGLPLSDPPTDEERHDAIVVLHGGPVEGEDPLYAEAQMVLDAATASEPSR